MSRFVIDVVAAVYSSYALKVIQSAFYLAVLCVFDERTMGSGYRFPYAEVQPIRYLCIRAIKTLGQRADY